MQRMEEIKSPLSASLEETVQGLPQAVEAVGAALAERYYVPMAEQSLPPEDGRPPESEGAELEQAVEAELESLRQASRTLAQAYQAADNAADELGARLRDMRTARDRKWYVPNPPANAAIDLEEAKQDHFAQGLGLYKVLLICIAGSFAGVVVEMLWCLVTNGYLESRAGLVYGPFNLLYGAGAALLTVCLYKYRNRGYQLSFAGGFLVGSVLEYVCSWGQEVLLGSRSWDYSHMPLNINGRICFVYSLFWGVFPFAMEIDQSFIAAILTVIGYQINDTVVVFDRVRENVGLYPKQSFFDTINSSINSTLGRTVMTSCSTLLVLLCIFILGGDSIRSFVFAMIFGVIIGTLATMFVAAPVAYLTDARRNNTGRANTAA